MTTKHARLHNELVDKTAGSLARIESLIGKTLVASRKYLPPWERKNSNKNMLEASSSSPNYKSVTPTKDRATKRTPRNVTNKANSSRKAGFRLKNKTQWKPQPLNPRLSGKSTTQSSNSKPKDAASTTIYTTKTEWKPVAPNSKLSRNSAPKDVCKSTTQSRSIKPKQVTSTTISTTQTEWKPLSLTSRQSRKSATQEALSSPNKKNQTTNDSVLPLIASNPEKEEEQRKPKKKRRDSACSRTSCSSKRSNKSSKSDKSKSSSKCSMKEKKSKQELSSSTNKQNDLKKSKSFKNKHVSFATQEEMTASTHSNPAAPDDKHSKDDDKDNELESSLTQVDLEGFLVETSTNTNDNQQGATDKEDFKLLVEADQMMQGWDALEMSHIFEDSFPALVDKSSTIDDSIDINVVQEEPFESFIEDNNDDEQDFTQGGDDFADLVNFFDHADCGNGTVGEFLGAFTKFQQDTTVTNNSKDGESDSTTILVDSDKQTEEVFVEQGIFVAKDTGNKDETESTAALDDSSVGGLDEVFVQEVDPFVDETEEEDEVPIVEEDAINVEEEEEEEENERQVVVLVATQTARRNVLKNQDYTLSILDYVKIDYITIDGTDPDYRLTRDELFELSNRRGEYPQFFHLVGDEATFLGGMDEFKRAMDAGCFGEWITDCCSTDEQQAVMGFM